MNIKTKIVADPKYIRKRFDVKYGLKTNVIIKSKDVDKNQAKDQVKMVSNCTTLDRI